MNSQSTANNTTPLPLEFLKRSLLFSTLEKTALEEIAGLMQFRAFGGGMTLFHQDMPGMTLYLISEGFVRLYAIGQSGQEFTYYIYGPNDIFGELSLLDNGFHSATCITLTPLKTWVLSKENLFNILAKYPPVNSQLMGIIARRVRNSTKKSEVMAFQDVQGRLAYEMLNLEGRFSKQEKDGISIDVPLSQAELASMVGATRESVNKALAAMKAHNLIKITGTNIVVTDKEGLQKMLMERGR